MSKYNIFSIDTDLPFADTFATGLWIRLNKDPITLRQSMIFVPHRRAARVVEDALVRVMGETAVILPQILAIGDADADEIDQMDLAQIDDRKMDSDIIVPAIPSLRRQILLTQLIRTYLKANISDKKIGGSEGASLYQASRLAEDLSKLLDRMQTENIPFKDLEQLVPDIYAEHWQKTLIFLKIITEAWPRILNEEGATDPASYRNEKLRRMQIYFKQQQPERHIIIAGSTGSIPATANLMETVAALPKGAVVLPGLDRGLEDNSWEAIINDVTHPQHVLSKLLSKLSIVPGDVSDWSPLVKGQTCVRKEKGRMRFLSEVMRPAITTEKWHDLEKTFITKSDLDGIAVLECQDFQSEASTIALILRETLETNGKTASLITADRSLARRVKSELKRWDINIDDSAGIPITETPFLVFWRLIGKMVEDGLAPVSFLAAMKHPLARGGISAGAFKRNTRLLEQLILRGPRPGIGIDGLIQALKMSMGEDRENIGALVVTAKEKKDVHDWIIDLSAPIRELEKLIRCPSVKVQDIFEKHNQLFEKLVSDGSENSSWDAYSADYREQIASIFSNIFEMCHDFPKISGQEYLPFLESLLSSATYRAPFGVHPRLSILGPLEGRLMHFDRVILAGLNEGSWPPEPQADPWMSRPMRSDIGLPLPEIRIGQSAHDFVQLCGAKEVFLTRSKRINGTPTVVSRWLLRMSSLIESLDYGGVLDEANANWISWQNSLDTPNCTRRLSPPTPRPVLAQRPRSFSVTQIGAWLRNPYHIYARQILKLVPLGVLDSEPIAVDRGSFIHKALETFVKDGIPSDLNEAKNKLIQHGRSAFGETLDHPAVWAFWWPRFLKIANWFVEQESKNSSEIINKKAEVRGHITLTFPSGAVKLKAIADRIDQGIEQPYIIIDYKTGNIPPRRELISGLSPQLPLEGLILREGGFLETSAQIRTQLKYIQLTGGDPPGKEVILEEDTDVLISMAEEGLRKLIEAFDNDGTPYLAYPDPNNKMAYDDYEHLSRVKEWSF